MQTKIRGTDSAGTERDAKVTEYGLTITLGAQQHWTARGYGKQAMATVAVAALVVRPTTTAMATLFNQSGSGKVLVVERAFAHNLVSTAAQAFYSIWVCVHPVGMAAPSNDITVRNGTSGKAAGGSNTIFDNGATVVDDGWFPWGNWGQAESAGVLPNGHVEADIGGRIMLPPTAAISIHVVASLVGDTFTAGFHWFEVPESELAIA